MLKIDFRRGSSWPVGPNHGDTIHIQKIEKENNFDIHADLIYMKIFTIHNGSIFGMLYTFQKDLKFIKLENYFLGNLTKDELM